TRVKYISLNDPLSEKYNSNYGRTKGRKEEHCRRSPSHPNCTGQKARKHGRQALGRRLEAKSCCQINLFAQITYPCLGNSLCRGCKQSVKNEHEIKPISLFNKGHSTVS